MKIGLVIDDSLDRPDGVQQYVLTLGRWLSGRGHEVHYLAGATTRTDVANVHSLSRNLKVTFNGNGLSTPRPVSRATIRRLLQAEQFDVLHVQMPYSPFLAHRIIQEAPASTVVVGTFHILPYSRLVQLATRLLGVALRSSLQRFDRVYAVSPSARLFARQAFGLPEVAVLPNVALLDSFAAAKPMPDIAGDGVPVVLFLGRLVARKGCNTFLEAVALLRRQLVSADAKPLPFRALVCGKGPLAADLQAQAMRLGIADIVTFTGFVTEADKPRYISSATVASFPSTGGESFGIVLIEAMAAGRPVVLAASNPGYASVMEPRPELLFAPGDAAGLAAKMAYYIAHPQPRQAVVSWQNEYVRQFDVAAVGNRLVAEYAALSTKKHEQLRKTPQS